MCMPRPVIRKASAASTSPAQAGPLDLVARQHDQREGHDGKAAHLPERAEPEVGDALPADGRAVGVRPVAQKRAERGRPAPGCAIIRATTDRGHRQFDDHHAVQRAQKQHLRHADRDLEQRQPQSWPQRQVLRGRVREGQPASVKLLDMLLAAGSWPDTPGIPRCRSRAVMRPILVRPPAAVARPGGRRHAGSSWASGRSGGTACPRARRPSGTACAGRR